jgi:hypothetical protein
MKNHYKKIIDMFLLGDYLGYEAMLESGVYSDLQNREIKKLIDLSWLNSGEKLSDIDYVNFKIKTLKSIDPKIINLLK